MGRKSQGNPEKVNSVSIFALQVYEKDIAMPTYDYKCQKCAHVFEIFQSMKAARIEKCPKCGGKVKRLIGSGAGIIFKGTGFYETDFKTKPKPVESLPCASGACECPNAPTSTKEKT